MAAVHINFVTLETCLCCLYAILTKLANFAHTVHIFHMFSVQSHVSVKLIGSQMELSRYMNEPLMCKMLLMPLN